MTNNVELTLSVGDTIPQFTIRIGDTNNILDVVGTYEPYPIKFPLHLGKWSTWKITLP